MSLTRALAEALHAVTYDDLDAFTIRAVKVCLADGLACMVAGRGEDDGAEALIRHATSMAPGNCSVIGEGGGYLPGAAALANGALAHVLDFEDTFEEGKIHPNASVIPTVLALAQHFGSDGRSMIAALAVGCEVACRLSLALRGDPARRGWYHPPMLSGIGAAAAGAHLAGLSPIGIIDAIGLAACQFKLDDELKRSPASSLRAMRDGLAARAAVEGVLMAKAVVRAVEEPLEGPSGLAMQLTGLPLDHGAMLDGFGSSFHAASVGIKRWPSCRGTHGAIAAAQELLRSGVEADDIASIDAVVAPPNDMLFEPRAQRLRPQTAIDAKFSVPFVFAAAMTHGSVGLGNFDEAARNDQQVLDLAGKVKLTRVDDTMSGEGIYSATLFGGRRVDVPVATLPVWRAGSIDPDDFQAKLTACLERARKPLTSHALREAVDGLEMTGAETFAPLI
ncbi:MmgE/PrpD family protein [Mesorhizobium sp. CAU 1741]|uniref:MmgE/PrpD family protein n=1 Tax=Mesorhizobium sp. CAU 1741 TaxID=3140366 RepID=UPI00325B4D48